MAPHSVNGSVYKKRVKKLSPPIPMKKNVAGYANIVLHYLSKLKSVFHTDQATDEFKSILKKDGSKMQCDPIEAKDKAFAIVDAALQYGYANDVIEKVGEYFLVKRKSTGGQYVSPPLHRRRHRQFQNSKVKRIDIKSKKSDKSPSDSSCNNSLMKRRRSRQRRSTSVDSTNYCVKCYATIKKPRRRR